MGFQEAIARDAIPTSSQEDTNDDAIVDDDDDDVYCTNGTPSMPSLPEMYDTTIQFHYQTCFITVGQ